MSTLGTFANFMARSTKAQTEAKKVAKKAEQATAGLVTGLTASKGSSVNQRALEMQAKAKAALAKPATSSALATQVAPTTNMPKAPSKNVLDARKKRLDLRAAKGRNKIIGGSVLGGLGLLGAGAIAYNSRNSGRRSEMSSGSAFANFAEKKVIVPTPDGRDPRFIKSYGKVTDAERAGTGTALTEDQRKALTESKKGKQVANSDQIKASQERLKKYAGQRTVEKNIDKGGNIYKGAKGFDYVSRTGALLGSPERAAIAAGKKSKNGFLKGSTEVAEKVGRAGYKTGATGWRNIANKAVGRTVTGKVARLGAAGIGLSAIGGALKRNRQERG